MRLTAPDGALIDEALVAGFPVDGSFTGETLAELHCHGGRATISGVLAALSEIGGLRPADPGEFTRRAVENGRLDLIQAEALADLVSAETDSQRALALEGLSGGLGGRVAEWRASLLSALALLEVDIDFSDEDIGDGHLLRARGLLSDLQRAIADELGASGGARAIREGFVVAIIGPPNVGKSTLLNAISRREVAIVSPRAGTTRDVLEVHVDLGGYAVTFLDTAGLRDTGDDIEKIGVARARERAASADLRVFLSDPEQAADLSERRASDIVVQNKSDLTGAEGLSAKTGAGVAELIERVRDAAAMAAEHRGLVFRERHLGALREARLALEAALQADAPEIASEEARSALRSLDALVGRIDVEDVLGEIFASFCIGK
jgi:tRNA modification GTPase